MEPSNRIGSEGQGPPAGAMSALRLATADCHRRLERRLAINERFSNVVPAVGAAVETFQVLEDWLCEGYA